MSFFNMGPRTEESINQDNYNASIYVLNNFAKDSPEYEQKKKELDFLFKNYKLKPVGHPFKNNQIYYIFDSKGFQQGQCSVNYDNKAESKFIFGSGTSEMVKWERPGWYRSGISAAWNRKNSFFDNFPQEGGKRIKLIRKKSQRRSRSRQRTQRRSRQSQRQRTQRRR